MAIPAKQIGQSQQSNLLWNISKQLENLIKVTSKVSVSGNPSTPTGIPFEWYPPAGLTNDGAKFTYTDGVELISYHIKGIMPINSSGNGFGQYLCTVNFGTQQPFYFPGDITGSFQVTVDNNIINTPLANGAVLSLAGGGTTTISDFALYLYPYENPQGNGEYWYALVASANTADSGDISALMSYDFEFLLPNFVQSPTIFQD